MVYLCICEYFIIMPGGVTLSFLIIKSKLLYTAHEIDGDAFYTSNGDTDLEEKCSPEST